MLVQSQGFDYDVDEFGGSRTGNNATTQINPTPTQKSIRKTASKNEQTGENVGKILYCKWGYDQTNVEFYKVVRETESSVWIQGIGSKLAPQKGDGLSDQAWMVADTTVVSKQPPQRYKKKFYQNELYVRISKYQYAHEWNGKPIRETYYA